MFKKHHAGFCAVGLPDVFAFGVVDIHSARSSAFAVAGGNVAGFGDRFRRNGFPFGENNDV